MEWREQCLRHCIMYKSHDGSLVDLGNCGLVGMSKLEQMLLLVKPNSEQAVDKLESVNVMKRW